MPYAASGLRNMSQGVGSAPSLWTYQSADSHATVVGAAYFANGLDMGLKANDVVIAVDTATPTCVILGMSSATTARAATLA